MRILVLGAGVIGSVYAGRLEGAGHEVVVLARGRRLDDLRSYGLVLQNADSGRRTVRRPRVVDEPPAGERFDLVLVAVRAEQVRATVPGLEAMANSSDLLFFGNLAGAQSELVQALGPRALFGFPGVGGSLDGSTVRYVLIKPQQTTLGEPAGHVGDRRPRHLADVLSAAGFPTAVSADICAWLLAHAAFIVPIAFALYRVGIDPGRLARDWATLRLMVRATREAFAGLRQTGNTEIPGNLRMLYRMPTALVAAYWRRELSGPHGELWFAAHTRAQPNEMWTVADDLVRVLRSTGRSTPILDHLLDASR